ncbi:MAG: hypothetical protein GX786_06070, partial [Clostridiales bacterium]|nr:hypothetical protein [Clostridiales bacterium]
MKQNRKTVERTDRKTKVELLLMALLGMYFMAVGIFSVGYGFHHYIKEHKIAIVFLLIGFVLIGRGLLKWGKKVLVTNKRTLSFSVQMLLLGVVS